MRDHNPSPAGADHAHACDDEQLVYHSQRGCSQCIELLFHRYHKLALYIARRVIRGDSEAHDVVQEVFLAILQQSASYEKTKSSVKTWIAQLAYFKALVRRRKLLSRKLTVLDDALFSFECHNPSHKLRNLERIRLVEECLASLDVRQRRTIELVHFEGYTLVETASVLQQSLANTRNQYYRGIQALRVLLCFRKPTKDVAANDSKSLALADHLGLFSRRRSSEPKLEE